jgi:hypothetical protein
MRLMLVGTVDIKNKKAIDIAFFDFLFRFIVLFVIFSILYILKYIYVIISYGIIINNKVIL